MLSILPERRGTQESTTHASEGDADRIVSDGNPVDSVLSGLHNMNPDPMNAALVNVVPTEYEIVLGRRQVASVLFLATVILAVTCAIAFIAGKSMSPKGADTTPAVTAVPTRNAAPPARNAAPGQAPVIEATIEKRDAAPITPAKPVAPPRPIVPAGSDEPPIFADPKPGATYIQMAAVDKGVSAIFAEGLRRRGFDAIVAPGPSENMYRVLIGPIPDPAAYSRIKEQLDQIGLLTFGRKYEK